MPSRPCTLCPGNHSCTYPHRTTTWPRARTRHIPALTSLLTIHRGCSRSSRLRSQPNQSNAHSTLLLLGHDHYHTMLHHMTKTYGSFGHDKRSPQKKAGLTKVKGTLLFKWLVAVCVLECVGATTSLAPKSGAATINSGSGSSGEGSPAFGGQSSPNPNPNSNPNPNPN